MIILVLFHLTPQLVCLTLNLLNQIPGMRFVNQDTSSSLITGMKMEIQWIFQNCTTTGLHQLSVVTVKLIVTKSGLIIATTSRSCTCTSACSRTS